MTNRISKYVWLILALHAVPAGAESRAKCMDVRSCISLAERTPAQFTKVLLKNLSNLSAPELVKGLRWKHERPEVTERARSLILARLEATRGHTRESAKELLEFIDGEKTTKGLTYWMNLIAQDKDGLEFLGALAERERETPGGRLAAMKYIGAFSHDVEVKQGGPEETRLTPALTGYNARVQRFVTHFWNAWLEQRKGAEVEPDIRSHVMETSVYASSIEALVRTDLAAGRMPRRDEFESMSRRHQSDRGFSQELLAWAESSSAELSRMASRVVAYDATPEQFAPADHRRYLKIMVSEISQNEDDLFSLIDARLEQLIGNITEEDARPVVELAQRTRDDEAALYSLALLADHFPVYRPAVLQRVLDSDLNRAARAIEILSRHDVPFHREDVATWVLAINPDQLSDEALQEQLIIVSKALSSRVERFSDRVDFPESRRPRTIHEPLECGTAVYERWEDDSTMRADLNAFGRPPPSTPPARAPASIRSKETFVPAPAPMTPKEAEVRTQQFRNALVALQKRLADSKSVKSGEGKNQ